MRNEILLSLHKFCEVRVIERKYSEEMPEGTKKTVRVKERFELWRVE